MKLATHDKIEKVQGRCLLLSRTARMTFFDLQIETYSRSHVCNHIVEILTKLDLVREHLDACACDSLLIGTVHFEGVPKHVKGEITIDEYLSNLETRIMATLEHCSRRMANIRNMLKEG